MNVSIIIPAYNEAHRILLTLQQVDRFCRAVDFPIEVLVIDDGSTDTTASLVRQHYPAIRLIQQPHNSGKFAAFKRGVTEASYDWILLYDADGATPITVLNQFLPLTIEYDCLIGSRRVARAQITVPQSWIRTILGRCAYLTIRFCTGLTYKDTQCGFKLCKKALAHQAVDQMMIGRFAGDVEFIYLLTVAGARIKEVPVEWHNVPQGTVKFTDYIHTFFDVLKIRHAIHSGQYQTKSIRQ